MSELRDRVRARALPVERLAFPTDRGAWDRAHAAVREAEAVLLDHQQRGLRAVDVALAQADVDEARRVLDEQPVDAWQVRALSPGDWDLLVTEHPAAEGATHGWEFDPPAFYPEMLAASVLGTKKPVSVSAWSDLDDAGRSALLTERLDATVWQELLAEGGMNIGEKNTLINTAITLNTSARTISLDAVGKGSAATRS